MLHGTAGVVSAKKLLTTQSTAFVTKELQSAGLQCFTLEHGRDWGRRCLNSRLETYWDGTGKGHSRVWEGTGSKSEWDYKKTNFGFSPSWNLLPFIEKSNALKIKSFLAFRLGTKEHQNIFSSAISVSQLLYYLQWSSLTISSHNAQQWLTKRLVNPLGLKWEGKWRTEGKHPSKF